MSWALLLVFFGRNSTYAFSAMLTTFLLGLALGSFVAGKLADRHGDPVGAFAVMEILIGLSALTGMLVLRGTLEAEGLWVMREQASSGWLGDVGRMFEASFAVMFVPTLLMGATFPLAGKAYVRSVRKVGRDIGAVYSVNTLGAILGAFVAGFFLLSWLGVQGAIICLAAINALVGLFLLLVHRASANGLRFIAAPALAAAVLVAAVWLPSRLALRSDFEDSRDTVLFYREDRAGTVKVFRKPDGHLLISVDGNTIGDTRDDLDAKQRLLAHLPLLLAPEPESILVIGLGSGITAGAMTAYEDVERIDAVEIVPGVVEGALYFGKHNRRALKQPRVEVVVADGINYLMTSESKYDVISSDAKLNPGYTGNAVFLSSDYYRLCLEQLTDEGMMVQWIPLHLPQESYRMVLRTFAEVFPYGSVWFLPGRHTFLIGTRKQLEIDMDRLLNRLQRPGVGGDLARFGLAHPWALLSGYRGGLAEIRRFAGSGPVSSWNHPYIEFRTPPGLGRETARNRAANLRALAQVRGDVRRYLRGMTGLDPEATQASWQRYARGTDLLLAGLAQAEESGLLSYGEGLFRQMLQAHPEDRRAQYWLARALGERRAVQDATAEAGEARDWILRGNSFLAERAFAEALEAFERAAALEPENAEAHYHLGVVSEYNAKGRRYGPGLALDRAAASYEKAISLR
ncbi:MAG: fused MFS/spermidine synthase, partial [Gemmatimonadetes bacterium]|nr:fused MFS/spermidine synthase [Gemmatimonadota bacterium]